MKIISIALLTFVLSGCGHDAMPGRAQLLPIESQQTSSSLGINSPATDSTVKSDTGLEDAADDYTLAVITDTATDLESAVDDGGISSGGLPYYCYGNLVGRSYAGSSLTITFVSTSKALVNLGGKGRAYFVDYTYDHNCFVHFTLGKVSGASDKLAFVTDIDLSALRPWENSFGILELVQ